MSYFERPYFAEIVRSFKPVDENRFFLIRNNELWGKLLFSSAKCIPRRKINDGISTGIENVKDENIISIYTQVIIDGGNYTYMTWVEVVDHAIFKMIIE